MHEIPYPGEILAVSAALFWSFSVVFFKRGGDWLDPVSLNLFKNLIASVLFIFTLLVWGTDLTPDVDGADYMRLIISGVIGMSIGDSLFLYCLNTLGAGRSQIVGCLYSPFVIALACLFLNEAFSIYDAIGTFLILSGIFITSRTGKDEVNREHRVRGVLAGALAVILMAIGVTVMKPVLGRTTLLWAASVRLFAGTLALAIFTLFLPTRVRIWASFKAGPHWRYTLPPTLLGTYLTMIAWVAGFKYAAASTAAVLNQMSAIFVLPVAAVILKESLSPRKLIAIALAVGGVILVILG